MGDLLSAEKQNQYETYMSYKIMSLLRSITMDLLYITAVFLRELFRLTLLGPPE